MSLNSARFNGSVKMLTAQFVLSVCSYRKTPVEYMTRTVDMVPLCCTITVILKATRITNSQHTANKIHKMFP